MCRQFRNLVVLHLFFSVHGPFLVFGGKFELNGGTGVDMAPPPHIHLPRFFTGWFIKAQSPALFFFIPLGSTDTASLLVVVFNLWVLSSLCVIDFLWLTKFTFLSRPLISHFIHMLHSLLFSSSSRTESFNRQKYHELEDGRPFSPPLPVLRLERPWLQVPAGGDRGRWGIWLSRVLFCCCNKFSLTSVLALNAKMGGKKEPKRTDLILKRCWWKCSSMKYIKFRKRVRYCGQKRSFTTRTDFYLIRF